MNKNENKIDIPQDESAVNSDFRQPPESLDEAIELLFNLEAQLDATDHEIVALKRQIEVEIRRRQVAEKEREEAHLKLTEALAKDRRKRLPDERKSVTITFRIPRPGNPEGEFQMYVIVGLYEDGAPGEIFIDTDKEGSFASAALDAAAMAMSMALQYGAPLRPLLEKWKNMRFPPDGATGNPQYPFVASPLDYLARKLIDTFCPEE